MTPWTIAYQALLSTRFSRQEYWSGLLCPPPRDLPDSGMELESPALAGRFFIAEPLGKPISIHAAKSLQSCPTLCDPIDSRRGLVGGSTFRRTPISRSPLDKNPMPGQLSELQPVNAVNTKGQFFRVNYRSLEEVYPLTNPYSWVRGESLGLAHIHYAKYYKNFLLLLRLSSSHKHQFCLYFS